MTERLDGEDELPENDLDNGEDDEEEYFEDEDDDLDDDDEAGDAPGPDAEEE